MISTVGPMTQDRPVLGIVLMLGFCVVAPLGDAVVKMLGASVPVLQLLLLRFGIQAAILLPVVAARGGLGWLRRPVFGLIALRTLLHMAGIAAMFTALKYLPLADAIAISFVMPFLMLLMGRFFLKEEVGMRRIIACVIGFGGTLMVVQPSFARVGWPALWPLAVAVLFSAFMLVTRRIARDTDPIGLQAVSGVMAVVLLIPAGIAGMVLDLPSLTLRAVGALDWGLLVSVGLMGTVAHLLMTWSLSHAPAATVAPMQYLEIPLATVFGFLIFGDLPNLLASAGIAVTIGAGVYVVLREHAVARATRRLREQAEAGLSRLSPPPEPAPAPQAP